MRRAMAGTDDQKAAKRQRSGEKAGDAECSDSASSSSRDGSSRGRARAKSPRVPFSLSDLEAEIAALRAAPPAYVSEIGQLRVPSLVCNQDGGLSKPDGKGGPWELILCVAGEEGDEAYGFPFKVCLHFDRDLWPMTVAAVRFQCVFHHAFTDENEGMMIPFYRGLQRDARGACTVRLIVEAVHNFLVDPLSSWKIPTESVSPKIIRVLDAHREMNAERFRVIGTYAEKKLHPELFARPVQWREEWLCPSFCRARANNTPEGWSAILEEHLPGEVFSFELFTEEFCKTLTAEIFNFYSTGLPARRPNSMNNYGIILNDIGLEPLISELQSMLQPLGQLLWPGAGSEWDRQHCFIVRYRAGEDLGLDMHTDDSDVTFNICLGIDFEGAGLQFCGLLGAPNHRKHTYTYKHVKGHCVCHLGRKRHGADDIESGERLNLILWNHSSAYRQSDQYIEPEYHKEVGPPDPVCVSYTHDRDYGNFKKYPLGKEDFRGRGWCPQKMFEYDGFKPDCDAEHPQS